MELEELEAQLAEARKRGNRSEISRLQNEIRKKKMYAPRNADAQARVETANAMKEAVSEEKPNEAIVEAKKEGEKEIKEATRKQPVKTEPKIGDIDEEGYTYIGPELAKQNGGKMWTKRQDLIDISQGKVPEKKPEVVPTEEITPPEPEAPNETKGLVVEESTSPTAQDEGKTNSENVKKLVDELNEASEQERINALGNNQRAVHDILTNKPNSWEASVYRAMGLDENSDDAEIAKKKLAYTRSLARRGFLKVMGVDVENDILNRAKSDYQLNQDLDRQKRTQSTKFESDVEEQLATMKPANPDGTYSDEQRREAAIKARDHSNRASAEQQAQIQKDYLKYSNDEQLRVLRDSIPLKMEELAKSLGIQNQAEIQKMRDISKDPEFLEGMRKYAIASSGSTEADRRARDAAAVKLETIISDYAKANQIADLAIKSSAEARGWVSTFLPW
jgi:hypothetical protein